MPRLAPYLVALATIAVLAGCQVSALSGPGGTSEVTTPNAIEGDPIEVTALDAPAPAADGAADAASDAPPVLPTQGDDAPAADAAETTEAAEPEPAVPQAPKSERQLACEKKGATWVRSGNTSLQTCVYPTRDAGKQCVRKDQCEGECLARSGTCAPIQPLLGCNEVLQGNGVRVTLCLE